MSIMQDTKKKFLILKNICIIVGFIKIIIKMMGWGWGWGIVRGIQIPRFGGERGRGVNSG